METFLKDVRSGARGLARQPGSALLSVAILGLGIGLSTFIFSLVYGVFFRGVDVPDADRIAVLERVDTRTSDDDGSLVPGRDYLAYRDRLRSFERLAGYYGGTVNLSGESGPERFQGAWVTADVFKVLRVRPVMGRDFAPGEDGPGRTPVVLLGHHVWRDRYGSDPDIVGRGVRVNGEVGTIIGVMPEGFRWPTDHDVWVTTADDPLASPVDQGRWYSVVGRLADGVSWDQAGLEVARVAAQLEEEHPEVDEGMSARLLTMTQQQNGEEITLIFAAMLVAALCVLLVACANVASLLLARAATRIREAGVRVALGAGRLRVMTPFLAEALVLAAAGSVVGTALAYWAVRLFDAATATPLTGRPYFMEFRVDLPVLLWVVGVTALTALAAGLAPAVKMAGADVNGVLKDEGRGASSLRISRLTRGLVLVEVALSVALLVGAGLMTKSIVQLGRHEMPFPSAGLMTARVGLFEADYPDREARQEFWREARAALAAVPGVESVALGGSVPGTGSGGVRIRIEGESYVDDDDRPRTHRDVVTPSYFETLRTSFVQGEGFAEPGPGMDGGGVVVVNRSFAERFWPDGSAVGRRFRTGTADTIPWLTIVGVVPDLQMQGFQPPGSPSSLPDGFYQPLTQSDLSFMTVIARARPGTLPSELAPGMRRAVVGIDPDLPLYDVRTVDEAVRRSSWFYSVFGTVFIAFGVAALMMASAGLYGVLSFSVGRRTQEMGIRMALGAEGGQVTRLVLRQGLGQVAVGLAIGLVLAAGVSSAVGILMFQVDPRDPTVFGAVVALIVLVGLVASLVPARRATRVDPLVALRSD